MKMCKVVKTHLIPSN